MRWNESATKASLSGAETANRASRRERADGSKLVALDPGEEPDWPASKSLALHSTHSSFEEIEDDLFVAVRRRRRHDGGRRRWLGNREGAPAVADLEAFATDVEGDHDEIEEWEFRVVASSSRSEPAKTSSTPSADTAGCAG